MGEALKRNNSLPSPPPASPYHLYLGLFCGPELRLNSLQEYPYFQGYSTEKNSGKSFYLLLQKFWHYLGNIIS
jgi:hypothetical protein